MTANFKRSSYQAAMEVSEPEALTDEQIEELLQRAEQKHRQQSPNTPPARTFLPQVPALQTDISMTPYVNIQDDVARSDKRRLLDDKDRRRSNTIKKIEDPLITRSSKAEAKKASAGSDWFNMPRTVVTPELKQDLQILRMRSVLDPKRHYKKESGKLKLPEYSQLGIMTEGPTEFFSARMSKAERKKTLVEEVLAGERDSGRFKRKYNEIQERKTSGKKGHYKAKMAKKYGKRYTQT